MVRYEVLDPYDVIFFQEKDPFTLDQLYETMKEVVGKELPGPFIHDLREVNLTQLQSSDMLRFITRFKTRIRYSLENPCVFLVRDMSGFGMMRMWSILAEVSGIRSEDKVLVTESFDEAMEWIADRIGMTDSSEIVEFIEQAEQFALAQRI